MRWKGNKIEGGENRRHCRYRRSGKASVEDEGEEDAKGIRDKNEVEGKKG